MMNFSIDEDSTRAFLKQNGWPSGIQDVCIKNLRVVPLRFMIVDDSGSMAAEDGHKIIYKKGKKKSVHLDLKYVLLSINDTLTLPTTSTIYSL